MEKVKVAISGFGRIGRAVARIIMKRDSNLDLVAVNDLADAASLAHFFKYDTAMGMWDGSVKCEGNRIIINGKAIEVLSEKNPMQLPWRKIGVDIVLESTGVFTSRVGKDGKPGYGDHIVAGAKKVVLSAPAKDEIELMVVLGVNDYKLTNETIFVSNASCTTNCLAPLAKVINDAFGIENGMMTTVHAYTNDQRVADLIHSDLRRARAAACNIIPTKTGAAKSIGIILPELDGKLDGFALRVPVLVGSVVVLDATLGKEVTKEEINEAVKIASEGSMKGILAYCDEPIVSSDIKNNPASSIFDSLCTKVLGGKSRVVQIVSWYDNEWGYSERTVDLMEKMASML